MAKDGSESLDAVVIPTLFLGELKYSPDEIACMVYFESNNRISEDLRNDKIPAAEIHTGIPIHINLKTIVNLEFSRHLSLLLLHRIL